MNRDQEVQVVTCPMCGGDGNRESEDGEHVLRGKCRTCQGRGVLLERLGEASASEPGRLGQAQPSSSRTVSVRLTDEHLNVLASVGQADRLTQGDIVRLAITAYGESRLRDPAFREKTEADRDMLDRVLQGGLGELGVGSST